MPELIDKQHAITEIENSFCNECDCERNTSMCRGCEYLYCMDILEQQPTIEAEPVRHGRWIERRYGNWKDDIRLCSAKCSECKRYAYQMKTLVVWFDADFCPNCGARMDGGADNG